MALDRLQIHILSLRRPMEQDVEAIFVLETWINHLILDMCAVTPANRFEQTIQLILIEENRD